MDSNLAETNLRTIRLLMERSALYRRALAPIMLFAGAFGVLAAAAGILFRVEAVKPFAALWLGTACVTVAGVFLLARRQALKDSEPFWSPPTNRVAQALLPPLLSGLFLGMLLTLLSDSWSVDLPMALVWLLFYGCALHSAGFFMVRGIKWFGWIFIGGSMILMFLVLGLKVSIKPLTAHWVMGIFFGLLHLAYGAYLYVTEKKNSVA